jgi:protein-disulfide isomerase
MTRVGPLDDVALESAVTEAGGDWRRVLDVLTGPAPHIDLQLAATQGQAFSLDLAGTPTYLIGDGLIEGAMTQSQFRAAFAAVQS